MSNRNLTNPAYAKLFPETYAKHLKLQAAMNSFMAKNKYTNKLESVEQSKNLNGIE